MAFTFLLLALGRNVIVYILGELYKKCGVKAVILNVRLDIAYPSFPRAETQKRGGRREEEGIRIFPRMACMNTNVLESVIRYLLVYAIFSILLLGSCRT